ncbi:helix-turn-helix domain-containing protein [Halorubrum sp. AD140]|uniref:helix-turn-helix domain-containing protein n=1 Tax=Halorubrum sp. AD140 TaxID=3050073 RepID=UPI002ACC70B1|nr:helix-turn-helix domain-containing protein [Halorubrum sp. AD140]MDZ5810781.1 helix-turn-helix domain-containing protein [Halorubrum sp. AD140]
MQRVTFQTKYSDPVHPIQAAVGDTDMTTRSDLVCWSPTPDGTALVWFDADRATVGGLLDGVDTVVGVSLHEDKTGTYALIEEPQLELRQALLDTISDAAVAFPPPVVFYGNGSVRFDAVGPSAALSDLYGQLQEYTTVDIETVRGYRPGVSSGLLTDRQREALTSAITVGYYEIPRNGTVADVADAIGCSRSTAGELLRKAEQSVITAVIE